MILKLTGEIAQAFKPFTNPGVTVIVATCAAAPEFSAVNAGIGPEPLAGMPMDGFEFVQLNTLGCAFPIN